MRPSAFAAGSRSGLRADYNRGRDAGLREPPTNARSCRRSDASGKPSHHSCLQAPTIGELSFGNAEPGAKLEDASAGRAIPGGDDASEEGGAPTFEQLRDQYEVLRGGIRTDVRRSLGRRN